MYPHPSLRLVLFCSHGRLGTCCVNQFLLELKQSPTAASKHEDSRCKPQAQPDIFKSWKPQLIPGFSLTLPNSPLSEHCVSSVAAAPRLLSAVTVSKPLYSFDAYLEVFCRTAFCWNLLALISLDKVESSVCVKKIAEVKTFSSRCAKHWCRCHGFDCWCWWPDLATAWWVPITA